MVNINRGVVVQRLCISGTDLTDLEKILPPSPPPDYVANQRP